MVDCELLIDSGDRMVMVTIRRIVEATLFPLHLPSTFLPSSNSLLLPGATGGQEVEVEGQMDGGTAECRAL